MRLFGFAWYFEEEHGTSKEHGTCGASLSRSVCFFSFYLQQFFFYFLSVWVHLSVTIDSFLFRAQRATYFSLSLSLSPFLPPHFPCSSATKFGAARCPGELFCPPRSLNLSVYCCDFNYRHGVNFRSVAPVPFPGRAQQLAGCWVLYDLQNASY